AMTASSSRSCVSIDDAMTQFELLEVPGKTCVHRAAIGEHAHRHHRSRFGNVNRDARNRNFLISLRDDAGINRATRQLVKLAHRNVTASRGSGGSPVTQLRGQFST